MPLGFDRQQFDHLSNNNGVITIFTSALFEGKRFEGDEPFQSDIVYALPLDTKPEFLDPKFFTNSIEKMGCFIPKRIIAERQIDLTTGIVGIRYYDAPTPYYFCKYEITYSTIQDRLNHLEQGFTVRIKANDRAIATSIYSIDPLHLGHMEFLSSGYPTLTSSELFQLGDANESSLNALAAVVPLEQKIRIMDKINPLNDTTLPLAPIVEHRFYFGERGRNDFIVYTEEANTHVLTITRADLEDKKGQTQIITAAKQLTDEQIQSITNPSKKDWVTLRPWEILNVEVVNGDK